MKSKKILFVYQKETSFINKDYELLAAIYETKKLSAQTLLFPFLLVKEIFSTHLIYIWFAKLHALLTVIIAKLFHKPVIVVAGGDDVASFPELKYGMYSYPWKSWCPSLVLRLCSKVLAVSQFNKEEIIRNAKIAEKKISLIPHGFDSKFFNINGRKDKKCVLTVARITSETIRIKALLEIVKAAYLLSDYKFILIGEADPNMRDYLIKIKPPNFQIQGYLTAEMLRKFYQHAYIYLQPSHYESFCCAVAEAMLCGCIPLVSKKGALPEVVGESAYLLENSSGEEIKDKIRYLNSLSFKPDGYRNRIKTMFSLEKRKKEIFKIVEELVNDH